MLRLNLKSWFRAGATATLFAGMIQGSAFAQEPFPLEKEITPIERLQQRSAETRWKSTRERFVPIERTLGADAQGEPIKLPSTGAWQPTGTIQLGSNESELPSLETGSRPALTQPISKTQARPFPILGNGTTAPQPRVILSVPDRKPENLPRIPETLAQPKAISTAVQTPPATRVPVPTKAVPVPISQPANEPGRLALPESGQSNLADFPAPPVVSTPMVSKPMKSTVISQPMTDGPSIGSRPISIPSGQLPSPPVASTPAPIQTAELPKHVEMPTPPIRVAQLKPIPSLPPALDGIPDGLFRPISEIQPYHDYSPTGKSVGEYMCPDGVVDGKPVRCPNIVPLPQVGSVDRQFGDMQYHWMASNTTHNPLYFEDVPLERYGHTYPDAVQPLVSVGKFGIQLVGLPYQMALHPVWEEQYPLGFYRPGDNAPHLRYKVPLNGKAALTAAGVYTGLIFLFP